VSLHYYTGLPIGDHNSKPPLTFWVHFTTAGAFFEIFAPDLLLEALADNSNNCSCNSAARLCIRAMAFFTGKDEFLSWYYLFY